MAALRDIVQLQTVWGHPTMVGDTTVTPQAQALVIRWPKGGLVWNRPVSVLVERDGQTERVPILDVTRIAQLGLFALGFCWVLFASKRSLRDRRKQNE